MTPTNTQSVPRDGEKVPPELIKLTHVPHPGVPSEFLRSSLLVGSRGAGKTFLLRQRRQTSHPGAVHLSLVETLSSISRDAGLGGRAVAFDADDGQRIASKTAALLAVYALQNLLEEPGVDGAFSLSELDSVLTPDLRATGRADRLKVAALRRAVVGSPLGEWPAHADLDGLIDALVAMAAASPAPFALFLDRAEAATAPSASFLVRLLDQTVPVLTVLAGRPGLSQLLPPRHDPTLVPGDHYDLVQIGVDPYTPDWSAFASSVVTRTLEVSGVADSAQPPLDWALRLSRESLRRALALAQVSLQADSPEARAGLTREFRSQQLATVRGELYPDHVDFEEVLDSALARADLAGRRASGPQFRLSLSLEGAGDQISLLDTPDTAREFLLRALRAEALLLPPGHSWHPYELPSLFEVSPLLVWDGSNTLWTT